MIDFCHNLQAPEILIDMRQWQYIKSMKEALIPRTLVKAYRL